MTHHTAAPRLIALDILRVLSAWAVMLGHLRNAVLPDFALVPAPGPMLKALYLFTGMGHQAVIVFFVLSGYFVGGSVVRAGSRFDWGPYLIARVTRLWTVLVPAILLTAICDTALLHWNPAITDAAHIASWHSIPRSGALALGWQTALANLFFLQTVWAPTYGSNGPLWSLAYEAWYYVLFPACWCVVSPSRSIGQRATFLGLAFVLVACMPTEMLWLFAAWLMGVTVPRLARTSRLWASGALGWVLSALLLAMLIATKSGRLPPMHPALPDLILAVCVTLLCAHVHAKAKPEAAHTRLQHAWVNLSEMSFSLYLVHMPLVFIGVGLLMPQGKLEANLQGVTTYLLGAMAISLTAWCFWWMFERHAPAVRKTLTQQLTT